MEPDRLLSENPGSAVFPRYAEDLAREGRTDEAIDILSRGLTANPSLASGYSVLADLLFSLHEEERAVENLLTAIKIDPQMPRDLLRLGKHFLEHEPLKADTYLKTAQIYNPDAERFLEDSGLMTAASAASDDTFGEDTALGREFLSPEPAVAEAVTFADVSREFTGIEPSSEEEPQAEFEREAAAPEPDESIEALFESFHGEDGDAISTFDGDTGALQPVSDSLDESALPEDGAYTVTPHEESLPLDQVLDFGIPDLEDEGADKVKVLEIQEEEGYDLSRFGFDSGEEEDVLTPEERAELLALNNSAEHGGEEDEIPGISSPAVAVEEEPPASEEDAAEPPGHAAALFGRLSSEEIEVLSDMERESMAEGSDLDAETSEGIDYSDVLSTWKTSDQSRPLDADVEEALSASFADELVVESPEAKSFSSLTEFDDVDSAVASSAVPVDEDFGEPVPSPEKEEDAEPDESYVPSGFEALESVPDEELTALEETIADGGVFDELSETEEALIRDFASGVEPEPESSGTGGFVDSPLGADVERWVHEDRPALDPAEEHTDSVPVAPESPPPVHSGAAVRTDQYGTADIAGEESLNDLIDAYARVTGNDADAKPESEPELAMSSPADVYMSEPESPVFSPSVVPVPKPEPPKTKTLRDSTGYTATMAEIYVSQGLLSRALEIFGVLADRDPDNPMLRSRIAELKTLLEQHPES